VVAGGTSFTSTTDGGGYTFQFNYDVPVLEYIVPALLGADGGDVIQIVGDNFGPVGTPIIVDPQEVLDCTASNSTESAHSILQCVAKAGRGSAMPVRVTVNGQASVGNARVNISYRFPQITSVEPARGVANSPKRLTLHGDNFGKSRINVRVFVGSKRCANSVWMPALPPKFKQSYILCEPPTGDTSGAKSIGIEFSDEVSFATSLYPELTFDNMYFVACAPGEYTHQSTDDGRCYPCPTGATCLGSENLPIALPGFMKMRNNTGNSANEIKFLPCSPVSACQGGGKCATGYETPQDSCVGCVDGYYKLSGECKKCPQLAGVYLALYGGAILVFAIFGLLLVKKGPSIAVVGVGVDYYQILSIFTAFDIRWPAPVKTVLNIVSISNVRSVTAPTAPQRCMIPS
jgi:hypothetical protein